MDSNHRSKLQQIYSLSPLATRESAHNTKSIWNCIKPMIGLEPITCWLQISCSANWATSAHSLISLSRVTPTGIEPVLPPWKGDVLTAWPWSQLFKTPQVGLEPTTLRLTAECSTDWAIEDYLRFYIPSKLHTFPQGSSSRFARYDEQPKNNLFFSNSTIFM